MEEKAIVVQGDKELALYELETRFAMATRQRELLEKYIKERLKPDKHYYSIKDDQKPSLTKEGAELICLPHALKAHYGKLSGPDNPPLDDTPYQITVMCELEANGKFAGEGLGSASSMITLKSGDRVQRQKDPGLRHNATLKMASKSAYIAATLNSTAASEFFTQDMEDDQIGSENGKHEVKDDKKYYCEKHKKKWFKSGKMQSYAHPVEGSKEWCYMPAEKPIDKATEIATALASELQQQPKEGTQKAEEKSTTSKHPADWTPKTVGELYQYALDEKGLVRDMVIEDCKGLNLVQSFEKIKQAKKFEAK